MSKKKTVYFKRSKYRVDDFGLNDLPLNRRQQFFDIIKNDWKTLLWMGLILFFFSLPYLTVDVLHWFIRVNLPAQLKADGGTPEMIASGIMLTDIIYEAILVVASLFVAVPLAGIARVLKRLVHGEGVLFKNDFFDGIRLNVWQFIVLMFIYGVLRFVVQLVFIYIQGIPYMAEIVYGVSVAILYIVFVPILLFMFAEGSIYKMKFMMNLKNSSQLAFNSILWMMIFSLLIFGVYFMRHINHPILRVGLDALLILVSPLYLLALSLFTMSRFDKYINQENYPDIYRKGLRPLQKKEE